MTKESLLEWGIPQEGRTTASPVVLKYGHKATKYSTTMYGHTATKYSTMELQHRLKATKYWTHILQACSAMNDKTIESMLYMVRGTKG
jgi:hypothetical protein